MNCTTAVYRVLTVGGLEATSNIRITAYRGHKLPLAQHSAKNNTIIPSSPRPSLKYSLFHHLKMGLRDIKSDRIHAGIPVNC